MSSQWFFHIECLAGAVRSRVRLILLAPCVLVAASLTALAAEVLLAAPVFADGCVSSLQQVAGLEYPYVDSDATSISGITADGSDQQTLPAAAKSDGAAATKLFGSAEIEGAGDSRERPAVGLEAQPAAQAPGTGYASAVPVHLPAPEPRSAFSQPLRNPFMPAWLPAYARAVATLASQVNAPPLSGQVEQSIERPSWIPGFAFSSSEMVSEYHNVDLVWWDKRPIPPRPQMMKLSHSVIKYWHGYKQAPYWVKTVPDREHQGSFTFSSNYAGGPKGWLVALDQPGPGGFPQYRYWFDQR